METLNEAYRSGRIHSDHTTQSGSIRRAIPLGTVWAYSESLNTWVAITPKRKVESVTLADLLHDPAVHLVKRYEVRDLVERYGDPHADHPHDFAGCACRVCAQKARAVAA